MRLRCVESQNVDTEGKVSDKGIVAGKVYTLRNKTWEDGSLFYSLKELNEDDYFEASMFIEETVAGKYGIVNEHEDNLK